MKCCISSLCAQAHVGQESRGSPFRTTLSDPTCMTKFWSHFMTPKTVLIMDSFQCWWAFFLLPLGAEIVVPTPHRLSDFNSIGLQQLRSCVDRGGTTSISQGDATHKSVCVHMYIYIYTNLHARFYKFRIHMFQCVASTCAPACDDPAHP
jgi:hypothetical protein